MKSFLSLIGAVLITSVIGVAGYNQYNAYSENKKLEDYKIYDDIKETFDEYDVGNYNNLVVTGEEAVAIIKKFQASYSIVTHTHLGSTRYPNSEFSVLNDSTSASYLDPDILFITTVLRDQNGSVYEMAITQKNIYTEIVDNGPGLDIKGLIVDTVKNGASSSMSWGEIAGIIETTLNQSIIDGNYNDELLKSYREQVEQVKKLYEEEIAKGGSGLDEQALMKKLEEMLELPAGSISTWDEGKEELAALVEELNNTKILVDGLLKDLEKMTIQEDIDAKSKELEDLLNDIVEANQKLVDLENLITDYKTSNGLTSIKISELTDILNKSTTDYKTLHGMLASLNAELTKARQDLVKAQADLVVSKGIRDKNKDNYTKQLAIANEMIRKYNAQVLITKDWQNKYENELAITNSIIADATAKKSDIDGAKAKLASIMGSTYNGADNLTTTVTKGYNKFKDALTALGLITNTTLGNYNAVLNASLNNIKSNIDIKGGYVLQTTFTGLTDGIYTIPQYTPGTKQASSVGYNSSGHTHDSTCYKFSEDKYVLVCGQ